MADREFLVDINPNIELPKYELILYNLYEQPITSLKNITDFNYKAFFIGIDEISFNIPAYRNEYDGQKVRNEIYDLVDGEYYILLNDKKYFIIDKINEKADDDGDLYKEIHAYSREYELSQKKVIDYKADSRLLYDSSNSIDENGLEKGILNYIFNHVTKSWSIGDIDVDLTLNEVYRALDFPNTNLIQVFQELQKIYNCIFMFDTINQKIDILKMDSQKIGQNKGLYISDGNFIKSLSKNINYDEVKTRLFVYGKDNISIQSISPTGQPYLDNFDTFKNTKFMTQDLIDALNSYQTKVENYNPDFEPLLTQLQQANQVMENLINADDIDINNKGLVALERALSNVQTLIDVKTEELAIVRKSIESATGTDLESLYADMKSIQSALDGYETEKENINTLIANKQAEIDNQQGVIDDIKQQMADLQYVLDINNPANFTAEQLKKLDKFIRIETYNDSNYTENNIVELYEEGKKMLAKISQPQIQFDVDVVDFLSIVECQHVWKKFILGDIVTLEHKELGFDFEVRLVGYEHNEEENSLNLKFSNTYTFDDDTLWMRDLLDEINTTSTAVDFNKYKWDKPDYLESKISKYIDMKLEEARQNILNAVGQRYLFDDSGLWLYKEEPDGALNPEQIRAINNTIALTKDNWITVSTAITPDGIVAEQIYGKLGNFARVNAEQIIVDNWIGDPVENNFKDYVDQIKEDTDNINNTVDHIISDGFITNIEANSLKTSFENIKKEAQNIIAIADENGLSTSVERTNCYDALFGANGLQPEINKWVGRNDYPIEITEDDRNNIINKFRILQDTMMALAEKIRYTREEGLKNGIRTEFRAADGEIIGRVEQIESNMEDISPHNIILSNENQSFVTDSTGKVLNTTTITTNIDTFKGTVRLGAIIGTPLLKNSSGATINYGTITKTNPTSTSSGSVTWSIPANTNISSDNGWIEIPINIEGKSYVKRLSWNKAKGGVKGEDGRDGKGILSSVIHYQNHANGTTPPTGTWGTSIPTPVKGRYLWTRTTTKYTDNSEIVTYSVSYYATDGQDGGDGKGIKSTAIAYQLHTSGNTTPTGTWNATMPTPVKGQYLWTRTVITYTDNSTSTSYSTSYYATDGQKGDKGEPGIPGEDGRDGDNARLVNIIPSNLYFIRDKNGIVPNNITLTPSFQNTTYQKWEYSKNGSTWTSITRTSSSTSYPWMNSTTRVLTIPKAWSILSNNDYVVFRITTTTGESDVQTISILYDVSELEGRVTSAEQKITPEAIINTVEEKVSEGGTTIAQKSDITQTMDEWVAKFDYLKAHVPFRYVRSSMQEFDGMAGWWEIEVFANGVNVALGKTVTGNGTPVQSLERYKYTDGDKNSMVGIEGLPTGGYGWLQVDLGQIYDNVESIIDYIALSEGTAYSYKLEVSEDGIKWHTIFDGVRNTSTNSFALNGFQQGITTINGEGVKVEHSGSNEYSMIKHDGFVRKWQHGEARYLNDIYVGVYTNLANNLSSPPPKVIVTLPSSFSGRGDNVEVFLSQVKWRADIGAMYPDGTTWSLTREINTVLEYTSNFNLTQPKIYVDAYLKQVFEEVGSGIQTDYRGLDFMLMVVGK